MHILQGLQSGCSQYKSTWGPRHQSTILPTAGIVGPQTWSDLKRSPWHKGCSRCRRRWKGRHVKMTLILCRLQPLTAASYSASSRERDIETWYRSLPFHYYSKCGATCLHQSEVLSQDALRCLSRLTVSSIPKVKPLGLTSISSQTPNGNVTKSAIDI